LITPSNQDITHELKIENFPLLSPLSPSRLMGGRGHDEFKWSRV